MDAVCVEKASGVNVDFLTCRWTQTSVNTTPYTQQAVSPVSDAFLINETLLQRCPTFLSLRPNGQFLKRSRARITNYSLPARLAQSTTAQTDTIVCVNKQRWDEQASVYTVSNDLRESTYERLKLTKITSCILNDFLPEVLRKILSVLP